MRDIGLGSNVDKVVVGLRVSHGRVGELNALGVLDSGDGNVTSGCTSNERYSISQVCLPRQMDDQTYS
jgi:hypothetical protein